MSDTDPQLLLELALHCDDQQGMAATGLSRTRLLHRALVAAHDPEVTLQHPELVQAVRAKLADSRRRSRRAA